jgi:hypothetical protein
MNVAHRRIRQVLVEHRFAIAFEQRASAQHPVHQRREVVDERALIDDFPLDLLGCHRLQGSEAARALWFAHAEPRDTHPFGAGKHDIRPQVTVHHPHPLRFEQCLTNLHDDPGCIRDRQGPGAKMVRQRMRRHGIVDFIDPGAVLARGAHPQDPG